MDKLTAETITNQQILQFERDETGSSIDEDGESADPDENEIEDARQRCADAINAARAAAAVG